MDIHSALRNRIVVATLGIGIASSANAFPRVNINSQPRQPIAPWSDPSDPLSEYGLQSFSTTAYRPKVDELLSLEDRRKFESLYNIGMLQLVDRNEKVAQATILAHGLLDVAASVGEDSPEIAFDLIREFIADFKADPTQVSQDIAQHLLHTKQATISAEDNENIISPPETRLGAKIALENLWIMNREQDIILQKLKNVFDNLNEARANPTNQMLITGMNALLETLDQCPEPGDAVYTLFEVSNDGLSNDVNLHR